MNFVAGALRVDFRTELAILFYRVIKEFTFRRIL